MLFVGFLLVGGVLAAILVFGGKEGAVYKQTVGKLEPWQDRAARALKNVPPKVRDSWGKFVVDTAHPSGTFKKVVSTQVKTDGERVIWQLTIQWAGGILGTTYTLVFRWIFNEQGSIRTEIVKDDALTQVSKTRAAHLFEQFSGGPHETVKAIADGKATWKK